ncbi:MAG: hypothetical protein ACHQ4H_02630 [Ktedonobacterales bacterium]
MKSVNRDEAVRLIALALAVLLESAALLSVILNIALFPGQIYPNVASVAVFVLPALVGLFAKRLDVALLLAVLPFFTLVVIYLARYAPLWTVDIVQLSVLVQRAANSMLILGLLSTFGWLVRRVLIGLPFMRAAKAP